MFISCVLFQQLQRTKLFLTFTADEECKISIIIIVRIIVSFPAWKIFKFSSTVIAFTQDWRPVDLLLVPLQVILSTKLLSTILTRIFPAHMFNFIMSVLVACLLKGQVALLTSELFRLGQLYHSIGMEEHKSLVWNEFFIHKRTSADDRPKVVVRHYPEHVSTEVAVQMPCVVIQRMIFKQNGRFKICCSLASTWKARAPYEASKILAGIINPFRFLARGWPIQPLIWFLGGCLPFTISVRVLSWFNFVTPELTIWGLFVTNICDMVWWSARPVSVTYFHIHKLSHHEREN